MTTQFEERMRQLHEEYGNLTPEERKELRRCMKKSNLLLFHRTERIKHELLRMETKRAQLSLDDDQKDLAELEERIINKKRDFLKLIMKYKQTKIRR